MPAPDEAKCCCDCCDVKTVCGRSLWHGVVFVGIASLVISIIVLMISLVTVMKVSCSHAPFYKHPTEAVNMIFGLMSICISIYQMIISSLLLFQAVQTKGNAFLCSVWYVSHLSILTLYFIVFFARAVVCFKERRYACGVITVIFGLLYEGIGSPVAAHEICIQQTDDMADGTIPPNSQMFRINRSNARFQCTHRRECCGNKENYETRENDEAASVPMTLL